MADTSIRVPVEVRDRLASLAADEGVSIGELVARLAAGKRTEDEAATCAKQAYDYICEHLVPDFGPDDMAAGQAYMDEVRRRAAEHYARHVRVLFDHTAVLAAGHRQLSYAIHDTGRRGGEILVPAAGLVAAMLARPGAAHHILSIEVFTVVPLDAVGIAGAEEFHAAGHGEEWPFAQARHIAWQMPEGSVVFTDRPDMYADTGVYPEKI